MTQQQYTPVSWQDETTSQQGTLINAERLNQMQTAHHYADGLEETDTVPTADPGVAYHKIVYCTADSTIYRWDGTQWTADIDDPTRELLEEHLADHDNPHQVTKAQVGLGNCDNTSDADKPISTATQTALNAKADKSDTYTKAQTDSLLGGKADKATTLAGYGISDAYTKTEADTLLGAKANDNAVVKLTGNQTKTGVLTLLSSPVIKNTNVPSSSTVPAGHVQTRIVFNANDDTRLLTLEDWCYSGGSSAINLSNGVTRNGITPSPALNITVSETGVGFLQAMNQRAYDPSNVNDIATIKTLDQYTPMVRTTGNQTISGAKSFTGSNRFTLPLLVKNEYDDVTDTAPSQDKQTGLLLVDKNGETIAKIAVNHLTSGVKEVVVYIHDKNKQQHKTVLATYTDS